MIKLTNILGSYRQISLEPVFLLFAVNIGLINIASQSIYIDKTCKVNLNETEAICDNIQQFNETQKEAQKYVSDIQAYNGALQVIIVCIRSLLYCTEALTERPGYHLHLVCWPSH